MRRDTIRLLMLAGVVALAVLYGMELSSKGISRVYGPMEEPNVSGQATGGSERSSNARSSENEEDWTLPPRKTASDVKTERDLVIPRNDRQPLVDRVSAATAEALHGISSGGIRFVVSLFDKVTGS
ncbi:hypothetical protein [Cohnella caldifontis]|uniref:hypothetical protein n=1 Tax=Cohnella caldifontis TaxID=3027471 RepID=UPI0023ECBB52|nr:hypothetical protein [Cohnella sp. YIM B05605]